MSEYPKHSPRTEAALRAQEDRAARLQMVADWPVLDRAAFTTKYPGWVNDEAFHVAYARSQDTEEERQHDPE